jgi:outer membrane protein TolC
MDQLQKDIAAEVREAILNQENAAQRLEATQASLKAANKNAEVQEEKYKQGLAIPLDLLNAQVAAATAQTDAVQALYDYYTSVAQLQLAIGK